MLHVCMYFQEVSHCCTLFCRTYEEDADHAIKQCQVLLEETAVESAVRIGDVYGFMVEHFARREKWKAVSCIHFLDTFCNVSLNDIYINAKYK